MRRLTVALVVLAALAALAFAAYRWIVVPRRAAPPPVALADTVGAGLRAVQLWFAAPSGDRLLAESRELPESATLHDRVAALVAELDRGPTGAGVAAVPPGTSLLHVYLDDEGLLTLDLSRAFQQGFRGGADAEYLAVASLVRTLAANVPGVKRVLIVCGGEPIATLGGHLPLDRPIDVTEIQ
jgi:spore germination protein GerM